MSKNHVNKRAGQSSSSNAELGKTASPKEQKPTLSTTYKLEDFRYLQNKLHVGRSDNLSNKTLYFEASPEEIGIYNKLGLQSQKKYPYVYGNIREIDHLLWLMNGDQKVRTLKDNQVLRYREETQKYLLSEIKEVLDWLNPSEVRNKTFSSIRVQYKKQKKKDCPPEMENVIFLLKYGSDSYFTYFQRFWPVLTIVHHPAYKANWIKAPTHNVYYRALTFKENEHYQKMNAKHQPSSNQGQPSLMQSTNDFFQKETSRVQSTNATNYFNPQNQTISLSHNLSSRVSQTSQDHSNASVTPLQAKYDQLHRNYNDLQISYQQKEQELNNSRQFSADKIGECQRLNEDLLIQSQSCRRLEKQKQEQSTEIRQLNLQLSQKEVKLTNMISLASTQPNSQVQSTYNLEKKLKEAEESIESLNRSLKEKEQELKTIKSKQADYSQRSLGISSSPRSVQNEVSFQEELAKANNFADKYKEELRQAKKIAEDASVEVNRLQTLLDNKEKGLVTQITRALTLCQEQSKNAQEQANQLKEMFSKKEREFFELKNREKQLETQLNDYRSKISSSSQQISRKQREDGDSNLIQSIRELCASTKSVCSQMSCQLRQKWQQKCSNLEAAGLKSELAKLGLKIQENANQARQSARRDQQKVRTALEEQKAKSSYLQIERVRLESQMSKHQRKEERRYNEEKNNQINTLILTENKRLVQELNGLKQENRQLGEQICLNEKKVLSKFQLNIDEFISKINTQAAKREEDEKSRVGNQITAYKDNIATLKKEKAALNAKLSSAEDDSKLYIRQLDQKDKGLKQKDAVEQRNKQLIAMLKEIMQLLKIQGRYPLEVQFSWAFKQIKTSINSLISRQKTSADLSLQLTKDVQYYEGVMTKLKELWMDYSANGDIGKIMAKYKRYQQNEIIKIILNILANMSDKYGEFSVIKSSLESQLARQTKEFNAITSELEQTKSTLKLHEENIKRQKRQTNSSLDEFRSEAETLRIEIGRAKEIIRQMEIFHEKNEKRIQKLTLQIEQYKRREEENKSQLINAQKKKDQIIAKLKKDYEQERKKNDGVFQISKATESKKGQLEAEIVQLKQKLSDQFNSFQKQKEEIDSLTIRQSQVGREKERIETELKEMKQDLAETRNQVKSAKSELEEVKFKIAEKNKQIAQFQVQIGNLQKEVSDFDHKYKLRFMDQLKSLSKELSHKLKDTIELRGIESIYNLVTSVSNGSQSTTTLTVSPLLQKEPSQRTFLIKAIQELTNKNVIGSKLLFFMDKIGDRNIKQYFPTPGGPQGNFAFVLLIRTKDNHIFGGFSEGVCDKECSSYGSILFSLTNTLLFKKNPKAGPILSCKVLDGFLILGNNELKIKFNDCSKVQTYAKSSARYFTFEREKMIGKQGKDEDWIAVQNFQLHEIEFEQ